MMSRSVAQNALQTLVVGLATFVLGITLGIITARVLGPNDRGILTLVTVLPGTLATFVKLGLAQGTVYAIRRERMDPGLVASHLLAIAPLLALPIIAALFLFRDQVALHFLKGADPVYLLLVLPLLLFVLLRSYYFSILQAIERFAVFNRVRLFYSLTAPLMMFLGLVVFGGRLRTAIIVTVALDAVVTVWVVWTVVRVCGLRMPSDAAFVRRFMKFGIKSHFQTMATHLHMKLDIYLIAAFLAPAEVAFYAIATRLAELLLHLPESLGWVLYPRQAASSKPALEDITAAGCRHILFSTTLLGAAVTVVGPSLIRLLYGEAFAAASKPLPFVVVGVIAMSMFFMLTRNFTSQNRQGVNIAASATALVANLLLNLILIPRLGISGAGISSALSYSLGTVILGTAYLRESRKRIRDVLVIQTGDLMAYRRFAFQTLNRFAPGWAVKRLV